MSHSAETSLGLRDNDLPNVTLPVKREETSQTFCLQGLPCPRGSRVQGWTWAWETKKKGVWSLCQWLKTILIYYFSQIWGTGTWSVNPQLLNKVMGILAGREAGLSYVGPSARSDWQVGFSVAVSQRALCMSSQQGGFRVGHSKDRSGIPDCSNG